MKRFSILSFTILCLTTLVCLPITAAAAAANSEFNLAAIAAFDEHNLIYAKEIFKQSLEQNGSDVIALQYLGKIALNQGELDDAEEYIEAAQILAPKNAEIHFDLAQIMGSQAQDASIFSVIAYIRKSLEGYKKAAQLEPEMISYRQGLMGFYLVAPGIVGGNKELAMVEAKAIAELDQMMGIVAIANVYQANGEHQKLKVLYENAQESFPDNPRIIFSRGMYHQSQEKFDLAITDFRNIQTMKASDQQDLSLYSALYQLGRSSLNGNTQIDEGIKALESFIDTAPIQHTLPSKPWAKFRLGLLYVKKGDKNTARKLYQEAQNETKEKTLLKKLKTELRQLG